MQTASFTIRENWLRPDPAIIAAFGGAPAALVADALADCGVLDAAIRPLWSGPAFVGPALTVETAPNDNMVVHMALKFARPGDVMMIAAGKGRNAAVIGGLTAALLRNCGVVGVVTDGAGRDLDEIARIGLPAYAAAIIPGMPQKHGPGSIGLAIDIGGLTIEPGDLVIGDKDGIVVVPAAELGRVLSALPAARAAEDAHDALAKNGTKVPPWAEAAFATATITYIP